MELSYFFANDHYQKNITSKSSKCGDLLNLKHLQEEVDKKVDYFEMIINGFLFPLKILKKLLYIGLFVLFLISTILLFTWFSGLQNAKTSLSDFQKSIIPISSNLTISSKDFLIENLQNYNYFDCKFIGRTLKCTSMSKNNDAENLQTMTTKTESIIKENDSKTNETENSMKLVVKPVSDLKAKENKNVVLPTKNVIRNDHKSEKIKISKAKLNFPSPTNSKAQIEKKNDSFRFDSNYKQNQLSSSQSNDSGYKKNVFPPESGRYRKTTWPSIRDQIPTTQFNVIQTTPHSQSQHQKTNSQKFVASNPALHESSLSYRESKTKGNNNHYSRMLQAVIQSVEITPKMLEKEAVLEINKRVYQLEKVKTWNLNWTQKLVIAGIIFILLYLAVIATTFFFAEKSVFKRINETLISLVIKENNSNGIYKYFIYGDYKYMGVKIIIKDASIDDLLIPGECQDFYKLDSNQIQARKLHLTKKNKRHNVETRNNYKNLNNSRSETSGLDDSVCKINETIA